MVVEREANGANKTTPGSEGGSLSKKDLTEPTLLEMSCSMISSKGDLRAHGIWVACQVVIDQSASNR